jgi:hypothetical protein
VTQDSIIAGVNMGANSVMTAWRSFAVSAHNVMAQFRATPCDQCSEPIRWWNRRVWLAEGERCAHPQCWNGQLFLKSYVQFMAEEIRLSAEGDSKPCDGDLGDTELRQLRASARALRERAERLEAQLRQAEKLAATMRLNPARNNGQQSAPVEGSGSLRPRPGTPKENSRTRLLQAWMRHEPAE